MSAVAATDYDWRVIDAELNRWGKWIEARSDFEGFPGANVLVSFLMGRGGSTSGHKILCLDMPTDIYATHGRVLRCDEKQQEALWIWFVIRLHPDGTLWTLKEKSRIAKIPEHQLRNTVTQAKRRILGIEA